MIKHLQKFAWNLELIEGCLVNGDGEPCLAFEVFKESMYSLSPEELDAHQRAVAMAINILPPGYIALFQDWYTKTVYRKHCNETNEKDLLAEASDNHFEGRPFREHHSYLFITAPCGSPRRPATSQSALFRKTLAPKVVLSYSQLITFKQLCRRYVQILTQSTSMRFRMLEPMELTGTKDTMGLIERYTQLQPRTALPQTADIERKKDGICVGDKQVLVYTVTDAEQLPPQISPVVRYGPLSTEKSPYYTGTMMPLGSSLDVEHIISLFLVAVDPAAEVKKLRTRERQLKSMSGISRENAVAHEAVTQHLEQVAKGEQRQIRVHISLLAWTEGVAAVPELKNKVISAFNETGATPHLETVGALQTFMAGIPGHAGDLYINDAFLTFSDQAACLLIPESNGIVPDSSFGVRLGDRATGIPQLVDLSDEPMEKGWITNRNKLVVGPSGSGKSYFLNLLLLWYYRYLAHILVLDIGGSYRALCELLGGRYFVYTEEKPIELNPFLLGKGEILDTEKKESQKVLLLTLYKKSDEPHKRSEYIAVSNMVEGFDAYYRKEGVFPCFNSFYEWLQEHYLPGQSAEGLREKDFDLQNFLYVLRPYYRGGEYEKLLNAPEQMNLLRERLIVFDLDSIRDHPILFPVVTILIMDLFIGKMRKLKGIRKVVVLEEAWKAIAKEGTNEYVKYWFKTLRKFFGEAIVATQDIEDLISSPVVKNTIINNTDCKILTDHHKFMNRFDPIQEVLGLTERDKALALSLNKANGPGSQYKEVFIALGANHSRVYRVEVSLEEHLAFTTEEKQRVKVNEYAKQHGGLIAGIKALAADIRSGAVKLLMAAVFTATFMLAPHGRASAQIIDVVDEAVKAALEEADLKIQQVQTHTLLLQNAQKALENTMAGDLLDDITGWVQQQQNLFANYYQELWEVKTAFSTYSKVAQLIERQAQLVRDYQLATTAVRQDPHFSTTELSYILHVYSGILNESIRNTGELTLVIKAFVTQMDDAGRLQIIDQTAGHIDRNYTDLQQYTQQNTLLSLQRAKDEADIQTIKTLYGIQ